MARSNKPTWVLLKLVAGIFFTLSLCFLGLFIATFTGVYVTSQPTWQFLNSENRVLTGVQLVFWAALWLWLYTCASRKLGRCNH
jgi:hypothetical protein